MSDISEWQALSLLAVLGRFPTERLTRCGATSEWLATQSADWTTHTIHWQAQTGLHLDEQPDSVVAGFISGSWPPPITGVEILSWPFGSGEGLFDNGDGTWTFLSDFAMFVDNGDGTTTVTPDLVEHFSVNGDLTTTVTIGL